jgi:hypothetical protein
LQTSVCGGAIVGRCGHNTYIKMVIVKKGSTPRLIVEELIDLLYELNDVYNVYQEVEFTHRGFFWLRLKNAIDYTAFAAEVFSTHAGLDNKMDKFREEAFSYKEQDGYVDKVDLLYLTEKAHTHIERIKLAYENEVDDYAQCLLEIIELYLSDTQFYIYGKVQTRATC